MRLGVARGNKNVAIWQQMRIVDGEDYLLPNGEVVRASVVPDPDKLPQYWEEAEGGTHTWSVGKGLRLSVVWSERWARAPKSIGPARIRFLTAAAVGLVPGSLGYFVREVKGTPEVWRELRDDDGKGRRTAWTVLDLLVADDDEDFEFRWAAGRASVAWGRLVGMK